MDATAPHRLGRSLLLRTLDAADELGLVVH